MINPILVYSKAPDDILTNLLVGLLTGGISLKKYDSTKTYNKDSVVWNYDPATKRISVYRCKYNGVVTLNDNDWTPVYLLSNIMNNILINYQKQTGTYAIENGDTLGEAIGKLEGSLDNHKDILNAHGATPEVVGNRLIQRDSTGRAKVNTPNDASDIANKSYVDEILAVATAGLISKPPVRVVLISNTVPTYGSLPIIDGVQTVSGDRVLLSGTDVSINGIYTLGASGQMTLFEKVANAHYYVKEGTTYGTTGWVFKTSGTGLETFQDSGNGAVAGNGLSLDGRIWSVLVDGITLEIVNDKLQLKSSYQINAAKLGSLLLDNSKTAPTAEDDAIWSAFKCLSTFLRADTDKFTGRMKFEKGIYNDRADIVSDSGRMFNSFYTTTNTSSLYKISVIVPWNLASTGLTNGDSFLIKFHTANVASPSLEVTQTVSGVQSFKSASIPLFAEGSAIPENYIDTNKIYIVTYNSGNFEIIGGFGRSASESKPGIMKLYTASGTNVDGTMTQKVITELLGQKAASEHKHQAEDLIEDVAREGGFYGGIVDPTSIANRLNYSGIFAASRVIGGTYANDYAECRLSKAEIQPGRVVIEDPDNDDYVKLSNERLNPTACVVSDTYGFIIGSQETKDFNVSIGVAGRVLVYPYGDISRYTPGCCLCSGPDGTVDVMTRTEVKANPECVLGTLSSIPKYETWGDNNVYVNGRIWMKLK